jgi:hypothetical protein
MSSTWYVRRGTQDKRGPFSAEQLKAAATQGKLLPDDLLWKEGLTDWVPALKVKGLFATAPTAAPVAKVSQPNVATNTTTAAKAHQRDGDPQTQLVKRALEELFSNHLPAITAGSSSLIAGLALPSKKLDGVRQYRAGASEKAIKLVFDSTMFGSASEGFAIFENGIAWRNSGSTNNGWKSFEQLNASEIDLAIESGMLGTKYLVLGNGDASRIKCGSLDAPTLERLVVMLAKAARIARGTDATFLRSKARHAMGTSDFANAAIAWTQAAEDPDAIGGEIIDEISAAIQKHAAPEPLPRLLEELCSRAADRSQRWSLKPVGQRVARLVTATELTDLWSAGQLFHDDRTKHFSEPEWSSASDAEPVASLPRIYYRDTGPYAPKPFAKAIAAVKNAIGDATPLFLGPLANEDVDGLYLCICDTEALRVVVPQDGEPVLDRQPIARAGVALDVTSVKGDAAVSGQFRFGGDSLSITIPQGRGLMALREAWKRVALASAAESASKERFVECQRTLTEAFAAVEQDAAVAALRKACKPFVEAVAEYHGGHPSFTEQCRGVLRLDEKGLEFVPVAFDANGYMRISYADIVEIAPPVLGEVPQEIQSSHASKQAAGAALSIAAAFLVGGQAGRAVGRSMRPDQAAVKPPKNRLGVSIRSAGTTYKLFFDVAGSDRETLEKTAKEFWASAATVRGRFGKKAGQVRAPSRPSGGGAAVPSGIHASDIGDLLLLCLELQLTGPVAAKLIETNRFTPQQLDARRNAAVERLAAVLNASTNCDGAGPKASPSVQLPAIADDTNEMGQGSPAPRPADDKPTKSAGRMSAATAAAIGLGVGVVAAGVATAAMAPGGRSGANGNDESDDAVLMDLDHDGRADAVGVDTDGDGDIDAVGVDRDGDGTVDAVALDTDNDGRIDTVGLDTDSDGDVDAVAMDTDGDGEADALAMDTDNDGVADVAAIDEDGDGDVDAVAMDTDHDGSFDALAVEDDDDHDALAMDDEAEEPADEVEYDDDGDDDADQYADNDDDGYDFEA